MEKENFINPFNGEPLPLVYFFNKKINASETDLLVNKCLNAINLLKKDKLHLFFKYNTLLKLILTYQEYELIYTYYLNSPIEETYCIIENNREIPIIMDAFKKIYININLFV